MATIVLEFNNNIYKVDQTVCIYTWIGEEDRADIGRISKINDDHLILDCSTIERATLIKIKYDDIINMTKVG